MKSSNIKHKLIKWNSFIFKVKNVCLYSLFRNNWLSNENWNLMKIIRKLT